MAQVGSLGNQASGESVMVTPSPPSEEGICQPEASKGTPNRRGGALESFDFSSCFPGEDVSFPAEHSAFSSGGRKTR